MQDVVMDMYDLFVGRVAERRAMDGEATKALADGRVFTGKKALDAGLIDAIGGEAEAIGLAGNRKGPGSRYAGGRQKAEIPAPGPC